MTETKKYLVVFPFSYKGRTEYIVEKFFDDKVDFSHIIHLTSRWTRIEDFRIKLAIAKKTPLILPSSYSLKSFAAKVVQDYTPYRLISQIEQILLLTELCDQMAKKTGISAVSLATRIKSLIKDFKVSHERIDFDRWLSEIQKYPWRYQENKRIVEQAFDVMKQYQNKLENNRLVDEDDLYRIAAEKVKEMNFDTVFLEGMLEFIPSQRLLIEKIAENSKLFISAYQYDESAPYDARTLVLEPNMDFLKGIADSVINVESNSNGSNAIVYNFPSIDEEVKGIAELILKEMSECESANWEDILVVFPDMLGYREIVQRIFRRMQIPFCMTPGHVLSQDPSIVAIISFLGWLDSSSWENCMSLFTSPFFSFDRKESEKFSKETREIFKGVGFYPDTKWLNKWKNWKKVKKAAKIMNVKEDSLTNWSNRLLKAIEEMGWKEFEIEGKISFMDLVEQLKSNVLVSRAEFINILKCSLNLIEVEKSKGAGVRVMGILDSTGIEAKIVFMGGATDEALPMASRQEEFFLPDSLKEILCLNTYKLKIARERLDVYRLKMLNKIVFTYPAKISGRQQNGSILLYDFQQSPYKKDFYIAMPQQIFHPVVDYHKFEKKFVKGGKIYFTVSQLDALARCPYNFYLVYVEEVEPYRAPAIEEIPEFWGILLHTAAERAASDFKGKIMDEQSAQHQYERFCQFVEEFLDNPDKVSQKYFYRIPPVVRGFLEKRKQYVFDSFRGTLQNHIGHRILDLEKQSIVQIGNMVLKGKFDRLEEREDGTIEIIDFKSGKHPKKVKKYPYTGNCLDLENLELPLYSLMQYKISGEKSRVFVWSLNFEEENFELEYPAIAEFLDVFESDLHALGEQLINGKFQFTKKSRNCYSCYFSSFCILEGDDDE
ncbi:MAG TPA: PD-(D/E)XK nuclease family protein [bacterium]|nr:PD-(D/E)XK nuclease family protein [bacterium]HOL34964.1 PD-(D/E)XK nuclease family protein [bacterium]HPP07732.1 PD-(D/E)XK nuclease family protein [bacterium]